MPCGRGPCLQQRKAQANEIDVVSYEVHYCCLLCNRPCRRGPCRVGEGHACNKERHRQTRSMWSLVKCIIVACCVTGRVGEGHAVWERAMPATKKGTGK